MKLRKKVETMNSKFKDYIITFFKVGVAVSIMYYMITTGQLDLQQITQIFYKKVMVLKVILAVLMIVILSTVRWYYLLIWQGITTSFKAVGRICCIGMFFNSFMPGAVGGDLVKAFYIAKDNKDRRIAAIMTIIIDRIIGFQTLMVVAFAALLFNHKTISSNPQLQAIASALGFYILCSFIGAACVFSIRVKRFFILIGIKELIYKLPKKEFLINIYDAFHIYANQKMNLLKAMAITILIDMLTIYIFYTLGRELGETLVSLTSYLTAVPVGLLMLSLPIAPAGVGVGQVAFYNLFLWFGAQSGSIGATIVTVYQLIIMAVGTCFVFVYLSNRKEVKKAIINAHENPTSD